MAPITTASNEETHAALLDTLDMHKVHKPFRNPNWKPTGRRNKNLKQILSEASRAQQSVLNTQQNSGASTPLPPTDGSTTPSLNPNPAQASQDLTRLVLEKNMGKNNSAAAAGGALTPGGGTSGMPTGPSVTYTSIAAAPSFKPKRKYCDITGLPAKYTEPTTGLHYYNKELYPVVRGLSTSQVQEYKAARGQATVLNHDIGRRTYSNPARNSIRPAWAAAGSITEQHDGSVSRRWTGDGQGPRNGNCSDSSDEDLNCSSAGVSGPRLAESALKDIRGHLDCIRIILDQQVGIDNIQSKRSILALLNDAENELESLFEDERANSSMLQVADEGQETEDRTEDDESQDLDGSVYDTAEECDDQDGDGDEGGEDEGDDEEDDDEVDDEGHNDESSYEGSQVGYESDNKDEDQDADSTVKEDSPSERQKPERLLPARQLRSSTRASTPRRPQRRKTEIEALEQVNEYDSDDPGKNSHYQNNASLAGRRGTRSTRNRAPVYTNHSMAQQRLHEEEEELENAVDACAETDSEGESDLKDDGVGDVAMSDGDDEDGDVGEQDGEAGTGYTDAGEARLKEATSTDDEDDPVINHSLARRFRRN